MCSWTAVGHTFVPAVRRSGHLCSIYSAVWSSRPQLQISDGTSFIFLSMLAVSLLWPVSSLLTTACCHRSRKCKSSLSLRCPRAALMRVFFSWKVTLLSCCLTLAPGSFFHFLDSCHCMTILACAVRPHEGFLQDEGVCLLL